MVWSSWSWWICFLETHSFSLHKALMDWSGVDYCDVFNQLFGLSFWRHPFTAEHPLVSKWCNATFLQICSHKETNSYTSWMAWVHLIFGWTIYLKVMSYFFPGKFLQLHLMILGEQKLHVTYSVFSLHGMTRLGSEWHGSVRLGLCLHCSLVPL